ncbi:MAG: chemotaxis protein CheB [Chloroflexota bacterium]
MTPSAIVVIGASAGGVEALTQLVRGLHSDLDAAVCVVLHIPSDSASNLPEILDRAGSLPAGHARDGDALVAGRILVAPPDHHLTVVDGRAHVARGPRENGNRPALDPLFRSAAIAHGAAAIGVVLSGALDDGAAGLTAIKARGGSAVIQAPDDAIFPSMPLNAAERVAVDHAMPAGELGPLISDLVARLTEEGASVSTHARTSTEPVPLEAQTSSDMYEDPPGRPSHYSCPECGGVLWHADSPVDADLRCRTGHAYSFQALERSQRDSVEAAMWTALRALEENALTTRSLAEDARKAGRDRSADRFAKRRDEAERQAAIIREALAEADAAPPSAG